MKDIMKYKGFKYMVDEHIKGCNKNNTPVEKSYKGNLNIRLSPELHKKAAYNASSKGLSLKHSNSFGTLQIILNPL
jgi:predicted HicB family RNase H-like nuclease